MLIYPVNGRVLVGTTDIEADPAEPAVCTDEEVAYFFDLIAHVFPTVPRERASRSCSATPASVRCRTTATCTRGSSRATTGWSTRPSPTAPCRRSVLVGGKWTTFRALGAHLAGEVMQRLGIERTVDLSDEPIGGARGFPDDAGRRRLAAHLPARPGRMTGPRRLLRRYGTRARTVAASEIVFGDGPVAGGLSLGELRYLVGRERAVHVADLVLRRTDLAFRGEVSRDLIDELAAALGRHARLEPSSGSPARSTTPSTLLNERHGLDLPS